MPSMTAYSPYETLTLFQSIAKYGADASTFRDISSALMHSEFVSQDDRGTIDRLSATALRGLYDELVRAEKGRSPVKVNGNITDGERSPKRRKLSQSPGPNHDGNPYDQQLVQSLVDKLYDRYKEEAVKEIRKEEEAWVKLQGDIKSLEAQIVADGQKTQLQPARLESTEAGSPAQTGSTNTVKPIERPAQTTIIASEGLPIKSENLAPVPDASAEDPAQSASRGATTVTTDGSVSSGSQVAGPVDVGAPQPAVGKRQSDDAQPASTQRQPLHQGQTPAKSPHPANPVLMQAQPGHHPSSQSPARGPPPPNEQQRTASIKQTSNQSHGSPAHTLPQHSYPPYQQYPPQWHSHVPHQYQPHPAYPAHYYPPPAVPGPHPQTPQQVPYQGYPHTAPVQYGPPAGWRGQPYSPYPASAANTPVSRPASRVSVTRSGSTTPWRKKRDPGGLRPTSPTRPERAISPLVDDQSPPPDTVRQQSLKKAEEGRRGGVGDGTPTQQTQIRRRGRPPSKTPSAMLPSRSHSNASHTSDTATETGPMSRPRNKIKSEAPSTPLPAPSDSEAQRSSGRRGRPRGHTTSRADASRQTTVKRKRESLSPSRSVRSPTIDFPGNAKQNIPAINHHPSLVLVSKNFSKTSQLLLNEITSHKLAGIFAKPLSERDAPGYKDLIYRPQDLKSIKAAISKGSRAALAAIELLETETENSANQSADATSNGFVPGPLGNGFYLVSKSSDLLPPKGIANGAQLETELIRMFANAIMFNPLPSSERGFGRTFKLRKNGGDVDPNRANTADLRDETPDEDGNGHNDSTSEESSTTTGGGTGWDEGGIIADTREMFDDVVEAVGRWRSLEDERMGSSTASTHNQNQQQQQQQQHVGNSRAGSIVATPMAAGSAGGGSHLEVNTNAARQASVSASSNIADDEGESTPVPTSAVGTARKRRRIAEH